MLDSNSTFQQCVVLDQDLHLLLRYHTLLQNQKEGNYFNQKEIQNKLSNPTSHLRI